MTGEERRSGIIRSLKESAKPVSGTALAATYEVSRQVIVQDIALIRAMGYEIISTHKGYLMNTPKVVSRIFKVCHTDEETEKELCLIVDMGACVENVFVNHRVYGRMAAELHINSRRKVMEFISEIKSGKSTPLKNITSNYHYHTVTADSEETLDLIGKVLEEQGFLVRGKAPEEV